MASQTPDPFKEIRKQLETIQHNVTTIKKFTDEQSKSKERKDPKWKSKFKFWGPLLLLTTFFFDYRCIKPKEAKLADLSTQRAQLFNLNIERYTIEAAMDFSNAWRKKDTSMEVATLRDSLLNRFVFLLNYEIHANRGIQKLYLGTPPDSVEMPRFIEDGLLWDKFNKKAITPDSLAKIADYMKAVATNEPDRFVSDINESAAEDKKLVSVYKRFWNLLYIIGTFLTVISAIPNSLLPKKFFKDEKPSPPSATS